MPAYAVETGARVVAPLLSHDDLMFYTYFRQLVAAFIH